VIVHFYCSTHAGFSVLHPGSTSSSKPSIGSSTLKNPGELSGCHVQNKVRSSEPTLYHCPRKRFIAASTIPTEKTEKRSTSSGNRKKTKESCVVRSENQPPRREILGAESSPGKACKSGSILNGDLRAIPIDPEKRKDLSVLEQVQQILAVNESLPPDRQPKKAVESGKGLPKKGIYRAERKNKRPVQNPEPLPEEVCKRQRGLSRADLQALVRKQRQDRKSERLNRQRAEQERRERIQRNLCATAQAAAVAAKAPLPGPRRPLLLTDRTASAVSHHVCLESEVYSYFYPFRSPICEEVPLGSVVQPRLPGHYYHGLPQQPTDLNSHSSSRKKPSVCASKSTGALWIPLSCHIPDPGSELALDTPMVVLDPAELQMDDHMSPVSSLEEQFAPDSARWMRLEAVGASEPETSVLDSQDDHFVDDLRSSDFDPSQLERRVDELLRLSRAPFDTDACVCTEMTALKQTNNPEYVDLKHWIYNDPLRLGLLKKQQERNSQRARKCVSPIDTTNLKSAQQPHWSVVATSLEPVNMGCTGRSTESRSLNGPAEEPPTESPADHHITSPVCSTLESNTLGAHAKTTTPASSPRLLSANSPTEQQDFITGATSNAISSTPRREIFHTTSLMHQAPEPQVQIHGVSLPPRLTAAALSLRLSEEVNHLEALACSIQHVADMESLRQYAGAQSETVTLAQLLQSHQNQGGKRELSRSPISPSPRKYPSVRSQATSITPNKLQSDPETHSPQFTEVIRAAEEFKKAERRLSAKASHMDDLTTKRVNKKEFSSNLVVQHPHTPRGDGRSEFASICHSANSAIHRIELSPRGASNSSQSLSEIGSEIRSVAQDSSAPESVRSLPADNALSALGDSVSESHSATIVFQEKPTDEAHSVSTASITAHSPCSKLVSEISSGSVLTARTHTDPNVMRTTHSSPSKKKAEVHQYNIHVPRPVDSSAGHGLTGDFSSVPQPNSVTPLNHTEDGSEDVLSLTQIDSGLLKRAEILKMRRERAEKLLALSKNLEKEEAEVVRLEMEALKAYQSKRKRTRIEELRHRFPKTSVDRTTSFSSKHGDQRTKITDAPQRSHRSRILSASPAGDSLHTVDELSNLSGVDLTSHAQLKTASIRARDLSKHKLSTKSPSRDSRTPKTLSTYTGLRNTTSNGVSKAETGQYSHEFIPSTESSDEIVQSSSSTNNRLPVMANSDQMEWSKRNEIKETTISFDRSSEHRSTLSANGKLTQSKTRQMQTVECRGEFPSPARHRLLSASAVSSTDDDEHGTEIPPDDSIATSVNSQIDLSAMESRIRALHSNLQRQEAILARINQRHKYVSTDRLVRFESTVMQHKQLCTEIIESIKNKLRECENIAAVEFPRRPSPVPLPEPSQTSISPKAPVVASGSGTNHTPSSSNRSSSRTYEGNSQPRTLASLAEDLVSATDTEGDLQKLEFDDKVGSVASSETLTGGTRTPEYECTENTPRSHKSTHNLDQLVAESHESTVSSVDSPYPSARNATSATIPGDEICTPASLPLSAMQMSTEYETEKSESSHRFVRIETDNVQFDLSISKLAEESEPHLGDDVIKSHPAVHQLALDSTSLSEMNVISIHEREPGQIGTAMRETKMNDATRQPLSRTASVKVGSLNYLTPLNADAQRSLEPTTATTTVATNSESVPVLVTGPAQEHRIQIPVPEVTAKSPTETTSGANKPDLVENLTQELFGKILSDAVEEVVHARAASKASELKEPKEDPNSLRRLEPSKSFSDHGPLTVPPEPSTDSPPEVDSPSDTDSLSDTAEASLNIAPSMFSAESVRGLVADVPSRVEPLIREALDHFWKARYNASEGTRESAITAAVATPPARFAFDVFEEADLNPDILNLPNVRFISRRLLFDLVSELIQEVYAGEDHEFALRQSANPVRPRVSSSQFRLWQGRSRPSDKEHLTGIVISGVQAALGLRTDKQVPSSEDPQECTDLCRYPGKLTSGTRFSRLAQWTLSKKSYLDRLLELELRADEGNWLSYVPEEQRLKRTLSDQIWNELLQESVDSMLKRWRAMRNTPQSSNLGVESVK
ncbi:hypothetical protein FGIG_05993, partial [Fasciola gigantica]